MKKSIKIIRTDSLNEDFILLIEELDAYLSIINGESDDYFKQFNKLDGLNNVVMVYYKDNAIGCGAFKKYDGVSVEIKRMYVKPTVRRKGTARIILQELEIWAKEIGFSKCVLETAKDMAPAVSFYKKSMYSIIPNYGQYKGIDSSICFFKVLN